MPERGQHSYALEEEYHYYVTDERGARHDLGSLVSAVLSIRRNQTQIREADRQQRDTEVLKYRWPADNTIQAGIEMGVVLAVERLYGDAAAQAFQAHCDEIERFLEDSDRSR